MEIEGTYLDIAKSIYNMHTVNVILKGKKKHFSEIRDKTHIPILKNVILFNTEILYAVGRQEFNWGKRFSFMDEVKLSLFANNMIYT